MEFTAEQRFDDGVVEREFILGDVPGIVWTPGSAPAPAPLILLGGITRLDTIRAALDEGFAFVAMGRSLLREPDLVNRMRSGASTVATCTHCNKCVPTIYSRTRCALDTP